MRGEVDLGRIFLIRFLRVALGAEFPGFGFGGIVSFRGGLGMAFLHEMSEQSGRRYEPNRFFKELSSIDHLLVALLSGRCG